MFDQHPRDRHLILRSLTERHPYRIAYAVGQQRTYSDRRFHTSVLGVAGLRDSEMKRIMHILRIHCLDEHSDRLRHHYDIRGLD